MQLPTIINQPETIIILAQPGDLVDSGAFTFRTFHLPTVAMIINTMNTKKRIATPGGTRSRHERKAKIARRLVANVPARQFEESVESDDPPTVTGLSAMAKRTRNTNVVRISEIDYTIHIWSQFELYIRGLAEGAQNYEVGETARGIPDHDLIEARNNVKTALRLLNQIDAILKRPRTV